VEEEVVGEVADVVHAAARRHHRPFSVDSPRQVRSYSVSTCDRSMLDVVCVI
jgi:hypothetical protein